jgi:Cu-Zn family superoxide dismutase
MRRPAHRLPLTVVAAAATASALFVASPAIAGADRIRAEGQLTRYDTSAVPEDARARVQAVYTAAGDSIVTLHVWGMAPNTPYGAHAHVNSCGSSGLAAGPHFQNGPDPVTLLDPPKASTDPDYANPVNEIWLDLTTDAEGNGVAQTKVPWQFSPTRRAQSVIIHVEHTHTGPEDSGVAGARLACLTVGF